MNKTIKILTAITVLISVTCCNAQTKNQKTETVKIFGNCAMCESTIEKAGSMKKVSMVDWNKDTKMATISYDSLKTKKDEILKRIALAGYDNEIFLAPDDTYSNLADCCQYKRAEKITAITEEPKMDMTVEHSYDSTITVEIQEVNQLSKVFENYFSVKDALVKSDVEMTSTNTKTLLKEINKVQMDKLPMDVHMVWMKVESKLKEDSEHIANSNDVGRQRDHFMSLSKNMYDLMKVSKSETPVYYQFCPMANDGKGANWLSKEESIKNPYYGVQMLGCGKTVETIH
jgi:hypothetical protein